jgi:heme exporter protein C
VNGSHRARPDRATAAATAAALLMALALAMIFFYVPTDVNEGPRIGYSQRIFYFHVPIAMTTYFLFVWGAVNGARYLLTRDMSLDLKSYVPMHLGVIFGSLTLATGSIWANIAWGTWWFWGDTQLTTFLIIFLFNCAYFMLRFSVEPGERRATYSAVYALLGVGLIPLSVLGVRFAQRNELIHPITFNSNGANMDGSMFLTFLVALAAILALAVTMYLVETRGKRIDDRVRTIRRLVEGRA